MKRHGIVLLVALFVLLAPMASAEDGSPGFFVQLVAQLVGLFLSDDALEGSLNYPPGGASLNGGDQSELGLTYPPGG